MIEINTLSYHQDFFYFLSNYPIYFNFDTSRYILVCTMLLPIIHGAVE